MITYTRYTELLSKRIQRTIIPTEQDELTSFEAAQPKTCPTCGAPVRSYFMPDQIAHDVEKCQKETGNNPG